MKDDIAILRLYNKIKEQYQRYATTKAGHKRNTEKIKYEKLLREWRTLPESIQLMYPAL